MGLRRQHQANDKRLGVPAACMQRLSELWRDPLNRRLKQGTEPPIPIPVPIPDLPGIGDSDGDPTPDLGSGVHPRPHPRFAGDRGSSPSPVPIGLPCPGLKSKTVQTVQWDFSHSRSKKRACVISGVKTPKFQVVQTLRAWNAQVCCCHAE
jgi:hypothetical protein